MCDLTISYTKSEYICRDSMYVNVNSEEIEIKKHKFKYIAATIFKRGTIRVDVENMIR